MSDYEGLEEERRLMYVAITRARKRLYLSHSQTRMLHGQTRYNVKSRFFDELPEAALKWLTPKNQGFAPSAFGIRQGGYATHARRRLGACGSKDTFASPPVPAAEGRAVARLAFGHAGVPQQVRRRHRHGAGRQRRRRAGAGELPPPRHQVAGAVGGETDARLMRAGLGVIPETNPGR